MSAEYRIFGPPGTGKTTYLARQVEAAVEKRGPDQVIVASFTRAAAHELAGRKLPLSREQIGTLHAHCFRALGMPKIAELHVKEWNKDNEALALTGEGASIDDPTPEATVGTDADRYMSQYQIYRAIMQNNRDTWPLAVRNFANKWEAWKQANGLLDFTDLIEVALDAIPCAPGDPSVGFFDECQDFVKLELALVRKWAQSMDLVLLAGDDDQCIYSFKGATPDAFLDPPVPEEQKRVLSQSWRLPRAIQTVAQGWIEQVSRREPKSYNPRDCEGEIRRLDFGFNQTRALLRDMETYLVAGKTVMILTACSYMLAPVLMKLREEGIPFHNPYRRSRGDWNPLKASRGLSSTERLLAYLRPEMHVWGDEARFWNSQDLAQWTEVVQADGVFKHGAKTIIKVMGDTDPPYDMTVEALLGLFEEPALSKAMDLDLAWLKSNLLATRGKGMLFPLTVATRQGPQVLMERPRVVIGTIHSVKGGEADVVYLSPDLSPAGMREYEEGKDSTIRQFYVGMTRARETLVIAKPTSGFNIELPGGEG